MYKTRQAIFGVMIILIVAALLGRLAYLQIVHGQEYKLVASRSLETVELLPAIRGRILDRNGKILAIDEACMDFCLDYRFIVGDEKWKNAQRKKIVAREGVSKSQAAKILDERIERTWQLARVLTQNNGIDLDERVRRIVASVTRMVEIVGMDVREQRMAHPIVAGLNDDEVFAVRSQVEASVGASLEPNSRRVYPYGAVACHIIGLTGMITSADMQKYNIPDGQGEKLDRMRNNYLPDDFIGITGTERMCERSLHGIKGYRTLFHDGQTDDSIPAEHGQDVHLTIDIELQAAIEDSLRRSGKNGSVVVISVKTGEVLAMASIPTFNLNEYRRNFKQLLADKVNLPLLNKAVKVLYPPGSTVKPITAISGMAERIATPQREITCNGHFDPNIPNALRCWNRSGHGPLDMVDAIKRSCNIYFYTLGSELGPARMIEQFGNFGFGQVAGTGLPEEAAGTLPTESLIRRVEHRPPQKSDAILMAIGQGAITTTPLHIANAMATIARKGEFLSPIISLEDAPPRIMRQMDVPESYFNAVQEGMYKVVNEPDGTAYGPLHKITGGDVASLQLCGKTGTSQTPPLRVTITDADGREQGIVKEGYTALFAGFGPYRNPQIAFVVVLEYTSNGGGKDAGPVALEVANICRDMGYIASE